MNKRKLPFYVEDEETVNKIIDLILKLNNEDLCELLDYFDSILENKVNGEWGNRMIEEIKQKININTRLAKSFCKNDLVVSYAELMFIILPKKDILKEVKQFCIAKKEHCIKGKNSPCLNTLQKEQLLGCYITCEEILKIIGDKQW